MTNDELLAKGTFRAEKALDEIHKGNWLSAKAHAHVATSLLLAHIARTLRDIKDKP